MKKILTTLFAAFLILGPVSGIAHAQTSCSTLTNDNYAQCCADPVPAANQTACRSFQITPVGGSSGGSTLPTPENGPAIRTDAQLRTYCRNLTSINSQTDYNDCCYNQLYAYTDVCYEAYMKNSNAAVPGTVTSGTFKTNPDAEQAAIAGNPNVSPQSSSTALAECSAIKFKSFLDILIWVKCIITAVIIPLIFTLAFLFFLWNVLQFIRSSDNANKEQAKERMVWGLIALFVMLSVWGIIKIMTNTLGFDSAVPLLQTEYLDPKKAGK